MIANLRIRKINRKAVRKYKQTEKGRQNHRDRQRRACSTLRGYLRITFYNCRRRCNNPKCKAYKYYGGRGIKCLFKSIDDFVDYVTNELSVKTLTQIKGLQIDRIDNDGHYEPGNIRFTTPKINNNNSRRWSHNSQV